MSIGDNIKKIRNLRRLTQKELGIAIGFGDLTADVRIAQYESGTRVPKEMVISKTALVLDVNPDYLNTPSLIDPRKIMQTLLHLDDNNEVTFGEVEYTSESGKPLKHIGFYMNREYMELYLEEWANRKKELAASVITQQEYEEWKINWPETADLCGQDVPRKKWRKEK